MNVWAFLCECITHEGVQRYRPYTYITLFCHVDFLASGALLTCDELRSFKKVFLLLASL